MFSKQIWEKRSFRAQEPALSVVERETSGTRNYICTRVKRKAIQYKIKILTSAFSILNSQPQ